MFLFKYNHEFTNIKTKAITELNSFYFVCNYDCLMISKLKHKGCIIIKILLFKTFINYEKYFVSY